MAENPSEPRSFAGIALAGSRSGRMHGVPTASAKTIAGGLVSDVQSRRSSPQPYQPNYVPLGFDSAFDAVRCRTPRLRRTTRPARCPAVPDHPDWPASFKEVVLTSARRGASSRAASSLRPGTHPGVVVVHGFNTNGKESVIRWAAMLARNGYNVLAADQRDFKAEYDAGYGYPGPASDASGWKESEDVLAAGRYLASAAGRELGRRHRVQPGRAGHRARAGARRRAAQKSRRVFSAGLNFSGPADQASQISSNGRAGRLRDTGRARTRRRAHWSPWSSRRTPTTDPCKVLGDAATYYGTTASRFSAARTRSTARCRVTVPLLNVYAADDSLVAPGSTRR